MGNVDSEDARLYARELIRLRLSLERARQLQPEGRLVALTHFPPLLEGGGKTPVSDLMREFGVDDVVYGHLHGPSIRSAFTGTVDGVRYHFTAGDVLGFKLYQIPDLVEHQGYRLAELCRSRRKTSRKGRFFCPSVGMRGSVVAAVPMRFDSENAEGKEGFFIILPKKN